MKMFFKLNFRENETFKHYKHSEPSDGSINKKGDEPCFGNRYSSARPGNFTSKRSHEQAIARDKKCVRSKYFTMNTISRSTTRTTVKIGFMIG